MRVAVVGLGRIGCRHAGNAAALAGVELVGVADRDHVLAAAVGTETGVAYHDDVASLLDAERPDGLVIATPPAAHAAAIAAAAERGVHVLCEKPLSHDLDEARAVLEETAAAGIKLQIGFQMRFDRGLREVADRIAAQRLGRLYQFRASLRDARPPSREYLAASGGYLWDGAIHLFDLARWLMGEVAEVTTVGASLSSPLFAELGDVDNAMVVLRFESGALGFVETSRVAGYGFESGVEVFGAEATCRVPGSRASGVDVYTAGAIEARHATDFLERFEPAYPRELQAFAEAIANDLEPSVTGRDGLEAMRICDAAVRSHRTGATVAVRRSEARTAA